MTILSSSTLPSSLYECRANHVSWVSPLGLRVAEVGSRRQRFTPSAGRYRIPGCEVCYERISVEPFREPLASESSSKGPSR